MDPKQSLIPHLKEGARQAKGLVGGRCRRQQQQQHKKQHNCTYSLINAAPRPFTEYAKVYNCSTKSMGGEFHKNPYFCT